MANSGSTAGSTDAVILVGGQGTRLRPLTLSAPKPMLPTAGLPFLQHLLARIAAAGITHVVLGTSYKAEVFEDHFGDGSELGLDLEYVTETEALGTGGGIRNVLPKLRADTVMVFNGDVLGGTDLNGVLETHHASNADVTLHLVRVGDPRAFGCVPTDETGRVTAFLEKTQDPPTDQINAGCYVFRREYIEKIPAGRPVSVEREVFPALLTEGAHIQGHVDTAYWRDMGTPEDFVRGSADLVRGIALARAARAARRIPRAPQRGCGSRRAAHRRHCGRPRRRGRGGRSPRRCHPFRRRPRGSRCHRGTFDRRLRRPHRSPRPRA